VIRGLRREIKSSSETPRPMSRRPDLFAPWDEPLGDDPAQCASGGRGWRSQKKTQPG
jgi:hypothetical protein